MASYQLTIVFDSEGLTQLQEFDQSVALIQGPMGEGGLLVVNVAFTPAESNILTWEDEAYVFASTTPPESGAVLAVNASEPAAAGESFTFDGSTITQDDAGPVGCVQLVNGSSGPISAGLSMSVTFNNQSPAAAVPATVAGVLESGVGTFPVGNQFLLCTISSGVVAGTVFPSSWLTPSKSGVAPSIAFGAVLALDFDATSEIKANYDDSSETFQIS